MEQKEKSLNIYERLSKISTELTTVAKNLNVGVGQGTYKAVGEADVLKAIKPLEAKYGVYSYPFKREIIESGNIENEALDYKTKEKYIRKQLFERIETTYRFVNIDNPNEYVDIISYGDGVDSQDKSVGKAMTYADKYALLKAYKIVTGEDTDQDPSGELKGIQTRKKESSKGLDPKLLAKAKELKIDVTNVATYLKKDVSELTNKELEVCISQKQKALGE